MDTEIPAYELDDGADEVVEHRPMRQRPPRDSVREVVVKDTGGRMSAMRAAGTSNRQEFILIRNQRGVTKIALAHFTLYKVLWRLWMAKRVNAETDPGITVAELVEGSALSQQSVTNILISLRRNEIVRSVVQHVGWRGTLSRYYPTSSGDELLKMAEYLGNGASVQVGRSNTAWRARNLDEPQDMFKFAALLRNGLGPLEKT